MIINIRGTSGSGKTTLMRHFFELCDSVTEIKPEGAKKIKGYECVYKGETVFVVGSYSNACGGCDTVSTQDEICQLIEDFSFDGHVLFEGLFISHIYGRYAEMAKKDPENFLFVMLETSFEICMEHIRERRRAAGKSDVLADSVFKNARRTYDSTYRIRDKLSNDNLNWVELPLEDRFNKFEDIVDNQLLDEEF
tara:strand:- start:37089 stop:37670 length:582 start_codon:yes stop_codon:yes gene_type:complete